MHKTVTILGSTGSVGTATMDVALANKDLFSIEILTAQSNVRLLAEQAKAANARCAVIGDESLYRDLKDALSGTDIDVAAGRTGILEAASRPVDNTIAAIVGMAGLEPMLCALKSSKSVAIANKEPLVAAGRLVMEAAEKSGVRLLPIDSEHNAIFQVFDPAQRAQITRLILTASGGPFREWTETQMAQATPAQAVTHPNWSRGPKISVYSATMMNKALEVIEAHYLFEMPAGRIDVMVHPQSIIHSMVEYADGSVLAQMGSPDMRVPITHALGWPDRIAGPAKRLDFSSFSGLTFGPVDDRRFPAINYAYACLAEGQAACSAMNAANEVAVAAFLEGRIGYLDIFDLVRRTTEEAGRPPLNDLESILAFDRETRKAADNSINNSLTDRKAS